MKRKKSEYEVQQSNKVKCLLRNSNLFNGDIGGKLFPTDNGLKPKADYLLNSRNNLHNFMVQDVIDYFIKNEIAFWKTGINGVDEHNMPTGHTLSSQIACLNHLYPFRYDKDAVLSIAKQIDPEIVDVMKIESDAFLPGFISFEVTSYIDHLNETKGSQRLRRGTMCTSIDALIYGKLKDNKKIIIPIEWKYTENYHENKDYSVENRGREKEGKGKERLRRYSNLINCSEQLSLKKDDYKGSVYFFEPFYQLMRQTLLAEQMIVNRDTETIKAETFIHAHIIPSENKGLLQYEYPISKKCMKETWESCLTDTKKYKIIDPKKLLENVDKTKYQALLDYLTIRYWNDNEELSNVSCE